FAAERAQPGMRLTLTDTSGWRIASAGDVELPARERGGIGTKLLRLTYESLVETGPGGRARGA
ncbi:MAG: hypothetical protein O2907_05335, partial [Proteobacteria bacterium]|nr:hypothetical protein [Pseudomonadota bacterium]